MDGPRRHHVDEISQTEKERYHMVSLNVESRPEKKKKKKKECQECMDCLGVGRKERKKYPSTLYVAK
jgi:predicted aldo/keto reductase-like oxidoreductase